MWPPTMTWGQSNESFMTFCVSCMWSNLDFSNSMLTSNRWSITFLHPTNQINSWVLTTLPSTSPSHKEKCWSLSTCPSQHRLLGWTPLFPLKIFWSLSSQTPGSIATCQIWRWMVPMNSKLVLCTFLGIQQLLVHALRSNSSDLFSSFLHATSFYV